MDIICMSHAITTFQQRFPHGNKRVQKTTRVKITGVVIVLFPHRSNTNSACTCVFHAATSAINRRPCSVSLTELLNTSLITSFLKFLSY